MMISIPSNKENINQLIYYILQNNNCVKNSSIPLKIIKTYILSKSQIILEKELFINLSLYKGQTIENKFMIIQILQLLYHNYDNKIIKAIFSNNMFQNQIFYNIINNFFECNIILKNEPPNNSISQEKIYLKEIIKNYLLYSIHYLNDNYYFDIEIPNDFNFEKYIEMINHHLEDISNNQIEDNSNLYINNNNIQNSLFNILIYSK